MRNARSGRLSINDIHVLTATSPEEQGLSRREQIGPCRPWIRFAKRPAPHSPSRVITVND
ncbi:protein GbcA [Pseudomonas avellanae]|uniref:Protein GbcA n=2 Tax=Pseudomonas syringae group TaxID=136849 RepID=A0A261WKC9_9PSED|nr:protein GbcA [Pseudomonas syringae pv. actinidiae]OZI86440.1 protein GbcA [Pseudomonas avellanae]PIN63179.1 protein GbcA [Pseudomonas syringae pv. actinidiae]